MSGWKICPEILEWGFSSILLCLVDIILVSDLCNILPTNAYHLHYKVPSSLRLMFKQLRTPKFSPGEGVFQVMAALVPNEGTSKRRYPYIY